ncbi:N-acetylmuramoyl-L-alanine amidase [Clostridium weizhouense]|uniref:N-acetylmuramoyl-L-alanine amidase n=1 Tax=Clostridium weizhouense TaxID=2859781 RepID=A0ABS7ARM9_9CLOT|nr:N-acetylmuramoyl-L-alanine amidase [Clostridium weizhouense]MBW6410326.1 N-acetylmuramoyl-L-alanine amidase [Clostridium weizhouense]
MKNKNKIIAFIFAFAIMLGLFPNIKVQAITNDVDIISESEVTVKQAKKWAKSRGATETFIDLANLYFKYSEDCGDVNPSIAYVQAAKETNFGKFTGVLDESFYNPCGLKTAKSGSDYDKNAHKIFDSWDDGVQAHMDHLALYAGANGYPKSNTYDPRHFITIKGKATTVKGLNEKWCPSTTYGDELYSLYDSLLVYSGIKEVEKSNKINNGINSNVDKNKDNNQNTSNQNDKIKVTIPNSSNASDVIKQSENNTPNITSTNGWKVKDGDWYYYKSDNTKATGWIKPDSNWYYLKDDGKMATGWLNDNGTWYYLKYSGNMAKGWMQLDNSWYFLQGDGSMVKGFKRIDGKCYFFNDSGKMKTEWAMINNAWHYFNNDGSMASGLINDGGKYYLNNNGTMATGWINIGSDSYYFDPVCGKMVTNMTVDGQKVGPDGKKMILDNNSNTEKDKDKNDKDSKNDRDKKDNDEKIIVVDAGHDYGKDYGSQNTINGTTYKETVLNIEVASKLRDELEDIGFDVIMTRESDERPSYEDLNASLSHRVDLANKKKADFFISIHHNSAVETAKGVETYYSVSPKDDKYGGGIDQNRLEISRKLAKAINTSIVNEFDTKDRGAKSDSERSLFVLRNTNMPAVLVECGFITNEEEAERCADSRSQRKIAEAIAKAIKDNF